MFYVLYLVPGTFLFCWRTKLPFFSPPPLPPFLPPSLGVVSFVQQLLFTCWSACVVEPFFMGVRVFFILVLGADIPYNRYMIRNNGVL